MTSKVIVGGLAAFLLLTHTPFAGSEKAELSIALESVSPTSDPHIFYSTPSADLSAHLYDALVRRGADYEVIPALAVHWDSDDQKRWRFELRRDVVFHSGRALTPRDVVYSFCRVREMEQGGYRGTVQDINGIELSGTHGLVIDLARPVPYLPNLISLVSIIRAPDDWAGAFQNGACGSVPMDAPRVGDAGAFDGTGAFHLERFEAGRRYDLARNKDYWGPLPDWKTVSVISLDQIPEQFRTDSRIRIDVSNSRSDRVMNNMSSPDMIFVTSRMSRTQAIVMNLKPKRGEDGGTTPANPLADQRVRRAISLAIDRVMVAQSIDGPAMPSERFAMMLPPTGRIGETETDPAQAARLMEEAGYRDGFRVNVETIEAHRRVAETIAESLAVIGISCEIKVLPIGDAVTALNQGDFTMMVGAYLPMSGDPLQAAYEILASPDAARGRGGLNYGGYSNPAMDQLIESGMAEQDPARRADIVRRIYDLASTELSRIPLAVMPRTWVLRDGLRYEGRADGMTIARDIRKIEPAGK